MAISNHERVGNALELLKIGLGPFVEREVKGAMASLPLDGRKALWRGDHVTVKQIVEDFAKCLYLPRLREPHVLLIAIGEGVALLTWGQDAFADSYDKDAGRYRGLCDGRVVTLPDADASGLLVEPDIARKQLYAESKKGPVKSAAPGGATGPGDENVGGGAETAAGGQPAQPPKAAQPKRFHGTVELDATRVGPDASRIADEINSHPGGLVGAKVKVTLELEAEISSGTPDHVVRTVTENGRKLTFTS